MMLGGLAAVFFAVNAEGKSLEDVATPLSVIGRPPEAIFRVGDHRGASPRAEGTVPDPRPAGHDDTARTRDDGTPLA
jgi:hypothetical protein